MKGYIGYSMKSINTIFYWAVKFIIKDSEANALNQCTNQAYVIKWATESN